MTTDSDSRGVSNPFRRWVGQEAGAVSKIAWMVHAVGSVVAFQCLNGREDDFDADAGNGPHSVGPF
jgi:hypothetical protein